MHRRILILFASAALIHFSASAATLLEEAQQLQKEAQNILRASSGAAADPKVYAEAVRKLESAQSKLEQSAKGGAQNDQLDQEISASLFWARRFANVNVIRELDKAKGLPVAEPSRPAEKPKAEGAAEAAFKKAEEFENSHKDDDYAVALRWFQFADEFNGDDLAMRGLQRAREAQARFQAKNAKAGAEQTPDQKTLAEGDALFRDKKFDEALAKFEEAKKQTDSIQASRRIGHAHLEIGYKSRDEYAAQYLPVLKQYNEALRKGDRAGAARLTQKAKEIVDRLRPLEQKALKSYDMAQKAFQHGLDLAKGTDLECEGQIAMIYYARGKNVRMEAKTRLANALTKYQPMNDQERTVYEFCKSLFKSLGGTITVRER